MEPKICDRCGAPMLLLLGCGWDYDRWLCSRYGCDGEIELETISYPDDEAKQEGDE